MKLAGLVDSHVGFPASRSGVGVPVPLMRAASDRVKAFFSAQQDTFAAVALAEAGDPDGAIALLDQARAQR